MTTLKSLPARPSQDSLRKQARKLVRAVANGDAEAMGRVHAQLPDAELPLTQRNAQLVIAREYGFAGWQQLAAEVHRRLDQGLEWANAQARRIIHDNDLPGLKQLLAEHPALLSWREQGGVLGIATSSYGDSADPERERQFTRAECAQLLLDAGAVVLPAVCEGLVESRAKGLLRMFESRGLLPHTLVFRVAVGDGKAVRALVESGHDDPAALRDALRCACRFEDEPTASWLLDQLIARDAQLGRRIDDGPGRLPFIRYLIEQGWLDFARVAPTGPWQAFVMQRVVASIHDRDIATFVRLLHQDPWLLGDSCVDFQVGLIERATLHGQGAIIEALFDLAPALLQRRPPPPSQALEFAFTYAKVQLLPLLTRVWPLPDDLPHAAGVGDLQLVRKCFDAGVAPPGQQSLDTALAWSVLNRHFDVADFLLAHGADINTRWSSHEPASILHELVFHDNREAMQFLIDRGIDMTIRDYRWGSTAAGWARHAANNEQMAQWLVDAERRC